MQIICDMVGAHFRPAEAKEVIKSLSVGEHLTLFRDPHNEYDKFAVGVSYEGEHLGFIPKTHNYEVAMYLDAGNELTAEIISFQNSLRPTLSIEIPDASD